MAASILAEACMPSLWLFLFTSLALGVASHSVLHVLARREYREKGRLSAATVWLGGGRSFGRHVGELVQEGPYRFSRNPQVAGGTLMVVGVALLWPSWYAL